MGRQTSLDGTEEQTDADTSKADSAIQRVPTSDLRRSIKNVAQLERNHTKDGVVLPVPGIANGDSDNRTAPITDEAFCTSVEDWLAAHSLGTGTVHKLVVEQDCAIASGQVAAFLVCTFAIASGRFVFAALAATSRTCNVLELQVDDLVNDNGTDATGPKRIRRSVLHSVVLLVVDRTLLILQLRDVFERLG